LEEKRFFDRRRFKTAEFFKILKKKSAAKGKGPCARRFLG
jgi:hypothetical protein